MEEFPVLLEYTGIYRYVTVYSHQTAATHIDLLHQDIIWRPWEVYIGLALISGSKLVLSLAVIRHLANWSFLSRV
jgi:phosphatidylethanolamine N-methyltransferase